MAVAEIVLLHSFEIVSYNHMVDLTQVMWAVDCAAGTAGAPWDCGGPGAGVDSDHDGATGGPQEWRKRGHGGTKNSRIRDAGERQAEEGEKRARIVEHAADTDASVEHTASI